MNNNKLKYGATLAFVTFCMGLPITTTAQQSRPPQSLEERNFERADFYRERAKRNAQSDLEYPFIPYQTGRSDGIDYIGLTHQIQVLAAQLQALAAQAANVRMQNIAAPGLELPMSAGGVGGTYGPEGPTEKSVAVVLEYRLMVSGNPNLKAGPISDEGDDIRAKIVTENGDLVDEYLVNKASGIWSPVR